MATWVNVNKYLTSPTFNLHSTYLLYTFPKPNNIVFHEPPPHLIHSSGHQRK